MSFSQSRACPSRVSLSAVVSTSVAQMLPAALIQESFPSKAEKVQQMTLEKSARALQKAFRLQLNIYRYFGSELFCMRDRSPACNGTIAFVNSFLSAPSKFLACSDTTSAAFITNYMMRNWKLGCARPPCL